MFGKIAKALLGILGVFVLLQAAVRIARKIRPFPIPYEAAWILDNPLRRLWAGPDQVVPRLGLAPAMRVLEVGPGVGLFTVPVARAIGPEGFLFCLDVDHRMVARTQARVHEAGLTNVEVRQGDAKRLDIPSESLDLAFFVGVLGEIPDKGLALAEVFRVLRPGGRISVTEVLPDPDYSLRVTTIQRGRSAGFEVASEYGNFLGYTVNFRKPEPV